MRSLEGKRALITGGAQGIGLEIARTLAADGAQIILSDIDKELLTEAGRSLKDKGSTCHTFHLDVTNGDAILEVRDRVHREVGQIQVLVNNAGVVFGGAFLEIPVKQHRLTYRVNAEGPMQMCHAFLPDLIASPEGHLVNMASASGFIGLPWGATYSSTKWAVIGLSESLRLELKRLGHHHVGVTAICPSYVATGMFEGAKPPLFTSFLSPEKIAAKVKSAILTGRPYVREPWLVKITPFLKGALPIGLSDLLMDAFAASSGMKSWTGRQTGKSS